MEFNGNQLEQLHNALLSTFPNMASLRMMVQIRLGENLEEITSGHNLSQSDFDLITWAVARGRLNDLIEAVNIGPFIYYESFDLSHSENERGRERIQRWGEELSNEDSWNWNLLGQAIGYYLSAIRWSRRHQQPWTNLAYVFHLIGYRERALECLAQSYRLATPGPWHPGRNHSVVATAIENDEYLSRETVSRPPIPAEIERLYLKNYRDEYREYVTD
ncbi:MAG TPA: effector-associated domain EAD1-containing protein [Chthonomonadaceae bacterium]|nr:effector-associated domain EAD1-containing protein [Chthonomonadaceae bacterium]